MNYNTRLIDIKNILGQWRRRMLTPIGRLTVKKALIIPKMINLIHNLPSPDKDFFLKTLKQKYNSIFGVVISIKVQKNIIIQEYRFRGLKLLDCLEFITALKSSLIRPFIQFGSKWINLLEAITCINVKVNSLWLEEHNSYQ